MTSAFLFGQSGYEDDLADCFLLFHEAVSLCCLFKGDLLADVDGDVAVSDGLEDGGGTGAKFEGCGVVVAEGGPCEEDGSTSGGVGDAR